MADTTVLGSAPSTKEPASPGAGGAAGVSAWLRTRVARQRAALVEAGSAFALSRLVLVAVSFIATSRLPLHGATTPQRPQSWLLAWYHWDAVAYIRIAQHGYAAPATTAFFPLWSLLIRGLGRLFGGSLEANYLAGLLLANACFFAALVLLYRLLATQIAPEVARVALICLAFHPYALFFFAGYTESLFLLLCVAIFLLLRRDELWAWWFAGVCGFFAALTRQTALALAVPMLVVALQRF